MDRDGRLTCGGPEHDYFATLSTSVARLYFSPALSWVYILAETRRCCPRLLARILPPWWGRLPGTSADREGMAYMTRAFEALGLAGRAHPLRAALRLAGDRLGRELPGRRRRPPWPSCATSASRPAPARARSPGRSRWPDSRRGVQMVAKRDGPGQTTTSPVARPGVIIARNRRGSLRRCYRAASASCRSMLR